MYDFTVTQPFNQRTVIKQLPPASAQTNGDHATSHRATRRVPAGSIISQCTPTPSLFLSSSSREASSYSKTKSSAVLCTSADPRIPERSAEWDHPSSSVSSSHLLLPFRGYPSLPLFHSFRRHSLYRVGFVTQQWTCDAGPTRLNESRNWMAMNIGSTPSRLFRLIHTLVSRFTLSTTTTTAVVTCRFVSCSRDARLVVCMTFRL